MRKLGSMVVAGVLSVSLITTPIALYAQSATEVCTQAEMDAKRDVNKVLWMGAGFFLGVIGVGAAYVLEPDPPAMRLVGKSPEYVATYTDCYKSAGRNLQVKSAVTGCAINGLLVVGYYACVLGTLAAAASP